MLFKTQRFGKHPPQWGVFAILIMGNNFKKNILITLIKCLKGHKYLGSLLQKIYHVPWSINSPETQKVSRILEVIWTGKHHSYQLNDMVWQFSYTNCHNFYPIQIAITFRLWQFTYSPCTQSVIYVLHLVNNFTRSL